MSRIGKLVVSIPPGVTVTVADGVLAVKGKTVELRRKVSPKVTIEVDGATAKVTPVSKSESAIWGTTTAHLKNMVAGVVQPFMKKLILEGVGYKVALTGRNLQFNVGFSHPVIVTVPEGIESKVEKSEMTFTCPDIDKLGQFCADIRAIKPPEPYKGKGIRYAGEVIRRKEGKKASK
jgi:large subunit ribosomal protein L6